MYRYAELQFERNARLLRESTDRREMQSMASEHNAAMLREALRVREEEVRAGESQVELANTMGDMHAAKVRYEEQQRIYQVGLYKQVEFSLPSQSA